MEMAGLALAGGRATGAARIVADPRARGPERLDGAVLITGGPWWPAAELAPPGVVGAIVEVPTDPPRPSPSVPVVGGLGADLFREGEDVSLDGDRGRVALADVDGTEVVTSFVERPDGAILLLRRSEKVGSFRGRWAGVSGFLEEPTPRAQAIKEIEEETGLLSAELHLVREGEPVYARNERTIYVVHPFRFRAEAPKVTIDWEHTEFEWVSPDEIARRPTVPHLDRAWAAVAPDAARKR